MSNKPSKVTVTDDVPKDPRWDQAREISDQLRLCGRLFLRGQVKLGMVLSTLKKECGIRPGKGISTSPDSGKVLPWAEQVKQQTGYSRQSCDEFIRLYEATKSKLKNAKKINLPVQVKKDAIVLFQSENPLTLSDAQWGLVDEVIGTLTTGETQASLLEELGVIAKPKAMPKGGKNNDQKDDDDQTVGQLAFHFFEAMAAPLINARTSPSYKKFLYALPLHSTNEDEISLSTMEAEARAFLADIEEAKSASLKPTRGRAIK